MVDVARRVPDRDALFAAGSGRVGAFESYGLGAYVGIVGPAYAVAFHFEGFRS